MKQLLNRLGSEMRKRRQRAAAEAQQAVQAAQEQAAAAQQAQQAAAEQAERAQECKICMEQPHTHAFEPCGHVCCDGCADRLLAQRGRCPWCQEAVAKKMRLYM